MNQQFVLWTGRALTAIAVLFLVFDTVIKLLMLDPVVESLSTLGYPTDHALIIGLIELGCLALYLLPRTAVLGAILLTALLGGGIASHIRIGSPLITHILFGVYLALFVWGGLWMRSVRLRALMPWQRCPDGEPQ